MASPTDNSSSRAFNTPSQTNTHINSAQSSVNKENKTAETAEKGKGVFSKAIKPKPSNDSNLTDVKMRPRTGMRPPGVNKLPSLSTHRNKIPSSSAQSNVHGFIQGAVTNVRNKLASQAESKEKNPSNLPQPIQSSKSPDLSADYDSDIDLDYDSDDQKSGASSTASSSSSSTVSGSGKTSPSVSGSPLSSSSERVEIEGSEDEEDLPQNIVSSSLNATATATTTTTTTTPTQVPVGGSVADLEKNRMVKALNKSDNFKVIESKLAEKEGFLTYLDEHPKTPEIKSGNGDLKIARLGVGVNGAMKVTATGTDGVPVKGVLKPLNPDQSKRLPEIMFKTLIGQDRPTDYIGPAVFKAINEEVLYGLATFFGFNDKGDVLPETRVVEVDGKLYTLQLWLDNYNTADKLIDPKAAAKDIKDKDDKAIAKKDVLKFKKEIRNPDSNLWKDNDKLINNFKIVFLDLITNQLDRKLDNFMLNASGRMKLIDNGNCLPERELDTKGTHLIQQNLNQWQDFGFMELEIPHEVIKIILNIDSDRIVDYLKQVRSHLMMIVPEGTEEMKLVKEFFAGLDDYEGVAPNEKREKDYVEGDYHIHKALNCLRRSVKLVQTFVSNVKNIDKTKELVENMSTEVGRGAYLGKITDGE